MVPGKDRGTVVHPARAYAVLPRVREDRNEYC